MRHAILPVSLGLAGLAITAAFMWWIFAGQREDVAVARAFLSHIAAEEHSRARALLSPALAAQLPADMLEREFGTIEAWDRLRFGRRNTQSFGEGRETELHGTGTTGSGCRSTLFLRLSGGLIDAFDITPLCPRPELGRDA